MFAEPTVEERERLAIEKRRKRDEERRRRLLDPKLRQYGVDTAALDEQIREKEERERLEKEREAMEDEYAMEMARRAQMLEEQVRMERAMIEKEVNEYRIAAQKKEQRREFDLSDPETLVKDRPVRVGDDDDVVAGHPSSIQVLDGEDLGAKERQRLQKEQLRQWAEQLEREKKERAQREHEEEMAYADRLDEVNARAMELDAEVQRKRKEMQRAIQEYNLAAARERKERLDEERRQETEDGLAEVQSHLSSSWLREDPSVTLSAADPHRFRPDHFKGLRPDQKEEILRTVQVQLEETERMKSREREEEEDWAAYQLEMARTAQMLENDVHRKKIDVTRQLSEENAKLAEEHRRIRDHVERDVYVNRVDESFFDAFGKSCR
eukprot:TRINITY_DN503_c0_g2_i1.p1 TRINITY_DN503_c0_g2~~TRINITY_DN503_c0_g2_i1.p1  ORF type:complete len:381 (+),score=151.99 TRINITY_DN503_c0_g2_i1:105-1247(+)